jgi:hypothetical protein
LRPATTVDSLLSEAAAAAGHDDFGPPDFLTGLEILLEGAAESPHAGPELEQRIRSSALNALSSRLSSQAGWASRPECLDAPLAPQVVVIGLPRSGTTALHQILAADPRYQWIPAWLAPRPRPRPPESEWSLDADYRVRVEAFERAGPNPLHDIGPRDPEECLVVMQQSFVNMTWVSSMPVPRYHDWFVAQDERPSYQRYRDNLRLIGADRPDAPWLLKNPSHCFGLASMLETFPDAVFVHIFRDPAETIVSGCSLIAATGSRSGGFAPEELGAHRLRIWSLAAARMIAARDAAPDRRFIDVDFRSFRARPLETVARIYEAMDCELSTAAGEAMARWVVERPKDRFGQHRYQPEDFGLTAGGIRDQMAGYIERYGTDVDVDVEEKG